MTQKMTHLMTETLDRLQKFTTGCNIEMHEPDNYGISAKVHGNHLDNAMGDFPASNCGEYTVEIINENGFKEYFNLATLIALARRAQ